MPESTLIITFVLTSIVLLILPGPAVLYIIMRSIDQGRVAGIASVLGLAIGTLILIIGVGFGISAVIMSSAVAFNILKYLGAIYLVYLGVRRFLDKDEFETFEVTEKPGLVKIFLKGILVNLLNPKTVLFFLAYLPQFTDASKGSSFWHILFFGILFIVLGLITDSVYATIAGNLSDYFRRSKLFMICHRYIAASAYISLGLAAAISGVKNK
jgi:threonine/homoserine/homoserine lactone efflux protein